jgi:hypothetical protein
MTIGTLIIEIYGELLSKKSIEILQDSMHLLFLTVSDKFDFNYKRFGYFAAKLLWVIPLTIFWQNDRIYKELKKSLDANFTNWTINITLTIQEKGD